MGHPISKSSGISIFVPGRNRLNTSGWRTCGHLEGPLLYGVCQGKIMFREVARRAGAGRLAYRAWHAPRSAFKRARKEGPINLALARLGRAEMERAATTLAPLPKPATNSLQIHYLTGRRFAYQTAFCAVSLGRQAGQAIRVIAIDDGTLTKSSEALLKHLLPELRVISAAQVEDSLDARLPIARYPELRGRRLIYPHLRKLVDVHMMGKGWKLVLDSDMLFHGRPSFLLDWLAAPDRPLHMVDVRNAYGYSDSLLRKLVKANLPSRLNVGICGLNSDTIDWDQVEHWCRTLVRHEGTHYLMEQAIVALLTAGIQCAVAPEQDYVVQPDKAEAEKPTAILHHYTADSKAWYYRFAWRHVPVQQ